MVGVCRIYVVIVVRIIVCKRHLCADVNVLCGQVAARKRRTLFRAQLFVSKQRAYRLFAFFSFQRQAQLRKVGRIRLERFVRVVQARVKDCHNHTFARIATCKFRRIVNTRLINGRFVGRCRARRRRTRRRVGLHRFGLGIGLRKHHALYPRHFLDSGYVTGVDTDCNRIVYRAETVNQRITDILALQRRKERVLTRLDLFFRFLSSLGQRVAFHRFVPCRRQQTVPLQADNNGVLCIGLRCRRRVFLYGRIKVFSYDFRRIKLPRHVGESNAAIRRSSNRLSDVLFLGIRANRSLDSQRRGHQHRQGRA